MKKLRVATVGAGYFAQFHHDAWARMDDVDLVAICDRDEAKARAASAVASAPPVYTDASGRCHVWMAPVWQCAF